jgi:protein-S-isoprenylcysteine O-methyltransferase Ste14
MKALELRIPPVVVVLLTGLLMWIVSLKTARFSLSLPFKGALAGSLVFAGMAISLRGVLEFRKARTTVNPTKPEASLSLVKSGIYRYTRNPMYLGFLLILVGWAVWLADAIAFTFLPAFVLFMNRFQIKPEERALALIFGEDFNAYCGEARRWI